MFECYLVKVLHCSSHSFSFNSILTFHTVLVFLRTCANYDRSFIEINSKLITVCIDILHCDLAKFANTALTHIVIKVYVRIRQDSVRDDSFL